MSTGTFLFPVITTEPSEGNGSLTTKLMGNSKGRNPSPTEYYDASDLESEGWNEDAENDRESLPSIRNQLFAQIEKLGALLPRNWMDYLINELGGPQNVAEISNREGRVVQKDNGQVSSTLKFSLCKLSND
jgi:hypothetical protein